MNAYVKAIKALAKHVDTAIAGNRDIDTIRKELLKKSKEDLVEMLIVHMKAEKVTVDSVAKSILEDADCSYLTYAEIAAGIADKLGTNTSEKSIASYASKRKGEWHVVPRKSGAERNAAIREMAGL